MSDTDNEPASRETRSNSKVYHHIPPRIDQEYYQVELPYVYHGPRPVEGSFLLFTPLLILCTAIMANWAQGTHEIHSTEHDEVKKSKHHLFSFFESMSNNFSNRFFIIHKKYFRALLSFQQLVDQRKYQEHITSHR